MPSRYPLYVLGLMVGINFLNYMDRWVATLAVRSVHPDTVAMDHAWAARV